MRRCRSVRVQIHFGGCVDAALRLPDVSVTGTFHGLNALGRIHRDLVSFALDAAHEVLLGGARALLPMELPARARLGLEYTRFNAPWI